MERAAELGDPEAKSNLGIMYLNGQGVEQSDRLAFRYLSEAAESGQVTSTYYLAILYYFGKGTARSCEKAIECLERVGKNGPLASLLNSAHSFYKQGDMEGAYLAYALASMLGFETGSLNAAYMV
jgi:TPR repeat protein